MNENVTDYAGVLNRHGIRLTAVRLLVFQAMDRFENTFSLADLT